MPRVIVGLDYFGTQLYTDVAAYVSRTGQPSQRETFDRIYIECISEVVAKLDSDLQTFMYNLMELPYWKLINYTPKETCEVYDEIFKNAVRAFGVCLWNNMQTHQLLYPNAHFHLESCTPVMVIITAYVNADFT